MVGRDTVAGVLLERDEQLAAARAAIDAVVSGSGSVVVLSGPAGIGKTAVLRAAISHAQAQDVEVLTARGEELERDLGHGVTRQLLDPALAALGDEQRAELLKGAAALAAPVLGLATPAAPPADPEFAARHGLTWLLAGLAEHRPLVLALDDAQWADAPALRWLAYLADRLDQAAVTLLLTRRTGEPHADEIALDAICAAGRELRLAPLTAQAVAELVRARTGVIADEDLLAACVAASGGNPFLLVATLAALDEEGPSALRRPLGGARRVAPAILRRLARLGPDATALARAVAVLGEGAELAAAAQLSGLPLQRTAATADRLVLADLFAAGDRLGFAHGLVRDAVAADAGSHAMRAAHGQAAQVLRALGAPAERIASHLLLAPPARDRLATADLCNAALRSLAQGAPTTAVTLLRRALAEPPPPGEDGGVLLELGFAELVSAHAGAPERLGAAIEALEDPSAKAAAAQARTVALIGQARLDEAVATIDSVRPVVAAHDAQLTLTLDALRLTVVITYTGRAGERRPAGEQLRRALASAQPGAVGTRGAAIMVAAVDAIEGAASTGVRAAVAEAWGDGALLEVQGPQHGFDAYGVVALWIAGEYAAMLVIATQIADRAADDGSVLSACHAWLFRAIALAVMGRLADAEAEAEATLQAAAATGLSLAYEGARAVLALIAIERGDLAAARARIAAIDAGSDVVPTRIGRATAAASLARARGSPTDERRALSEIQGLADEQRFATWIHGPWPAALAVVLGPGDEARELATRALSDARMRGRPGEIGLALRARALIDPEGPDIERLRAAVAELERSELALEHARTLVELGAALRRCGHRSDARRPLAGGLELATRCGATALAERAGIELRAAGARPRRLMVTGRDALTPSERRIAMLAAEGRSNREIAQTLFVTGKTVETHLSHTYRKLDITSRTQLTDALTNN